MTILNDNLNLYIALNGNDANEGTLEEPFKSFEKAVEVISKNILFQKTVNVFVRAGKYYFSKPLTFSKNFTCNEKSSICFKKFENEEVIISGAVKLMPKWEDYDASIKVAQIGTDYDFDILYVDGNEQILARYPNYKENEILNGYSKNAISPERVARWSNPIGGFIRALHDREWGGNSYIITKKNEDNTLEYTWVGDNNRGSGMHKAKRMVENIFEELDSPGEWYYNRKSGQLFFYPPKGMDIDSVTFEGAANEELIKFIGESIQRPVRNITFDGFIFTQTHRTLFSRTYERPLRSDWGLVRGGSIYLQNAENITIKNSKFTYLGGNAVMMSAYNKNHLIDRNEFTNIGASAVLISGLQSAARDASMWDNSNHKTIIEDFIPGPQSEDYPRQITISNNYITNTGTCEKQSAGVCISICENITISYNTIHLMPRAGINIGDGTFGGHIVEYNDVFDCVRETGDHGPFNSWGRDRFWSLKKFDTNGNFGREKRPYALLDARSTNIIRNNRICGNHAFGIDLDNGSTNYEIYNNLCLGVGIKLREGFDRKVYNNILVGNAFEIHVSFEENNDSFYNNIVYNSKAYNYRGLHEVVNSIKFKNSIYWNNGKEVIGLFNQDEGSLLVDPLFVDTTLNDFSVENNSPAVLKGFVNFPMRDDDFGVVGKPKPSKFVFFSIAVNNDVHTRKFNDAVICNILDDGLRSVAGLPDYNGAYIVELEPNGYFNSQGFRKGDVIREINGNLILDIDSFHKEYNAIQCEVDATVKVYRDQQPLDFLFAKKAENEDVGTLGS